MPITVLYDLDCGFCRWSVAQLLRADRERRLVAVPIQSPRGDELLASVRSELRTKSAHAVGEDGVVHSGGDATSIVAAALPHGAPLAWLSRTVPLPFRLGYRLVAGNRMQISKLVSAERKTAADAYIARRRHDARS